MDCSLWLSLEWKQGGWKFLDEFLQYQIRLLRTEDAGHGGPFYYHFLVLLIGCFPASIFALEALRKNPNDTFHQVSLKRWMLVLLCVVLLVFSIVKTKIIHYSSLCYFPITFLGAYYLYYFIEGKMKWTWRQTTLVLLVGGSLFGAIMLLPFVGLHRLDYASFVKDDFARQALEVPVYWSLYECGWGVVALLGLLLSLSFIYYSQIRAGVYTLLVTCCLLFNAVLSQLVPRIEKYSQHSLLEFLQSRQLEDCYLEVDGFKSYAPYFYGEKRQPKSPQELDRNFVLLGPTTKPVYLITKINRPPQSPVSEQFQELYRRGGYVFWKKR